MRNNSVNYSEFGPLVQMSFKKIFYLELWRPLRSVEQNHYVILVEYYQEHSCKIILIYSKKKFTDDAHRTMD